MPHETSRSDTGESARQLCDRWRATSLRVGWAFPADWWVPAVDAVAEALCDGRDPAAACAQLGRSRAEAAVGLDEALADLAALCAAVTDAGAVDPPAQPTQPAPLTPPGAPPTAAEPAQVGGSSTPPGGSSTPAGGSSALAGGLPTAAAPASGGGSSALAGGSSSPGGPATPPGHLVQALALGWAEVMSDPTVGAGCEDALTGLALPAYLRVRLGEIYREGERRGLPVPATHALVVAEVELSGGGCLTHLSRSVLLAECLRVTFSGGETLCVLMPGRVGALARRSGGLSAWAASLRRLLATELDPFTDRPARVWVEGLPGSLPAAYRLVAELGR
jgi:hypothetical protein